MTTKAELMPTADIEDRLQIRRIIKKSLRPNTSIKYNSDPMPEWVQQRIHAMIAYGSVDKSRLPSRALQCVNLHYCEGWPIKTVAEQYNISERTVCADMAFVLNYVIDHTPEHLMKGLRAKITRWRLGGCSRCGGDLNWDAEGTHGLFEGEYVCLQCGRRYDVDNKPITLRDP